MVNIITEHIFSRKRNSFAYSYSIVELYRSLRIHKMRRKDKLKIKPNLGENSAVGDAASLSLLYLPHLQGHHGDVGGEQERRQRAVPVTKDPMSDSEFCFCLKAIHMAE